MTREAELELEIVRLREFISAISKQIPEKPDYWSPCSQCERNAIDAEELLDTPPPTTALQDLITKVERRTIERCALAANEAWFEDPCYIHTITDAIRALPTENLKLEDL